MVLSGLILIYDVMLEICEWVMDIFEWFVWLLLVVVMLLVVFGKDWWVVDLDWLCDFSECGYLFVGYGWWYCCDFLRIFYYCLYSVFIFRDVVEYLLLDEVCIVMLI